MALALPSFEIVGSDGETHRYACAPHPPSEGMDILWILMALGGEPLARLAQSVLADALQGVGETSDPPATAAPDGTLTPSVGMSRVMDSIDLEKVDFTAAAKDLRLSMASLPMTDLVHKLIRYTTRDGKPLKSDLNFRQAYTANYMEMMQAVWRVIAINGFLPQVVTSVLG